MGLKAAVQALKKAEPLKDKVQRCKDLLNDNDAWVCQQQLQKIYQQVLILDLEYALDRKVEQELWNLGFKNYIAMLQSQAKDRKNPKRGESQAMLSWCLEAASGFYLTLLQEICTAFDLDLPFRRKGYVYGCIPPWKAVEKLSAPHKSSCFYACQYCLVHLGDIARYRNQNKQAELFYRHAVSLSPSSGQPYNQLALLEASRGDKLGTVFHYARSVAVKHPFPVATANLAKTLSSALNDNSFNIEGKTKLNSQEYIAVFLKLHGVLHNLGDLNIASIYVKLLTETLTALVATESFSSWRLVQMLVINLYALQHAAGTTVGNMELLKVEQLSADEKIAKECILDLIAGSLSALLLPVYTIKNAVMDYFALPTIKLCLDWIRLKPAVLEETAFSSRLQIWPSLCVLLNGLQGCVVDFKYDQYSKVPLPEDRDLQGFLPLEKSFETLRFTNTDLEGDTVSLNKLRAVRIIHLGRRLAQHQVNGSTLITIIDGEKEDDRKFTSMTQGNGLSNELIKELEELTLNKERQPPMTSSPVPSESASSRGSWEADLSEHNMEKRVGILKPQGSLERNREATVSSADSSNLELNSLSSTRKPRQNIAMQAIMRRAETEQKQVTFKNVSPIIIEEGNLMIKPVSTSPTKITGNKNPQINSQLTELNSVPTQNSPMAIQSRPLLTQNATISNQSQTLPTPNQLQTMKLQLNIPHSSKLNQFSSGEQQTTGISQFASQSQNLIQTSYQSQPFNVQNPQFSKNFMTGCMPNMSQYQMQGQFSNTPQSMSQNIGMQQSVNQNRPLHQRLNQSVSQSPILQQNIGLTPTIQQGIGPNVSQNIGLHQASTVGLQQNMGLHQTPTAGLQQNMGLGQNIGQSIIQNNTRTNGLNLQSQINMPGSSVANNIAGLQSLSGYQKNLQQGMTMTSVPSASSISPTGMSNLQLNFNPNFGQNTFNQMYQKQMSPVTYGKNSGQFTFPNQVGTSKTQQSVNSYPMFRNYEAKDFSLWKDTQPPQPPVAWWGQSGAPQVHSKETSSGDAFQNWANSPSPGSMISRVPLTPGNNYQQNPLHGRHYNRNSFDEARSFEIEQKQPQSPSAGNTYSLFSGNTWGTASQASNTTNQDQMKTRPNQQSLWSGPGPSPLERLLEQQKSLREGGT